MTQTSAVTLPAKDKGRAAPSKAGIVMQISDEAVAQICTSRIFLGHQSVGANILEGLQQLMTEDPRLNLRIVNTNDPSLVPGPALFESSLGENRCPETKDRAFAAMLDRGMGHEGGTVGYKYCYIDVNADTDIQQLFESYLGNIESLRRRYPLIRLMHITMPLTLDYEPSGKVLLKSMLGRVTARELNHRRNQFNSLLRQKYAGRDPIMDLEELESTNLDGSRCCAWWRGKKVYALSPNLAADSGHLNEPGRALAAKKLLMTLAEFSNAD